jgi:hypothetical protein
MNTHRSNFGSFLRQTALVLALTLVGTLSAQATLLFTGVDLKTAGRTTQWAIFALSGGITITDTTVTTFDPALYPNGPFTGNPSVRGDVGVSGGNISLSGTTKVQGTAYVKTGGLLRKSGNAQINGNGGLAIQSGSNDTVMNQVKTDAIAASNDANMLPAGLDGAVTSGFNSPFTVNQNTSLSITGEDNENAVLYLTDFILSGNATFTLTGTATSTFVFNITNKFSLLGAKFVLNGVPSQNILFNVLGTGSDISLASAAEFYGVILATSRTVNLSGAAKIMDGTLIAGKVNISGGSRVSHLPLTSP